ncbi:MAG: class I SAM-dependent methyltransferase, partial [Planctomycetota bacterium]
VVADDFSLPMLRLGVAKARARGGGFPRFLAADTLMLPFEARTFDGAVVGFGIRNVERLDEGLRELERVLRPGARLVLLEFTELRNPLLGPCFRLYLRKVLPAVGNWVSGSRERAYSYLQSSVDHWPDGDGLAEQMRRAGFRGVTWRPLFPGNVALHAGVAARGER